jgi:L-aspartate oxidase
VARAIFSQWQTGMRPMLDTRDALGARVKTQFPAVAEACARNGIDPALEPIPVAAAAHYHMGGIATDTDGRASLGGLWVCGEASSTGLHGANRLASNGLLEALVYARICAEGIVAKVPANADGTTTALLDIHFEAGGVAPDPEAVMALRQTMTSLVGVVRDADGLKEALRKIDALENAHLNSPSFMNMTATATLIAGCALMRRESRGAHERSDYPDTFAGEGLRSKTLLSDMLALRAQIAKDTV